MNLRYVKEMLSQHISNQKDLKELEQLYNAPIDPKILQFLQEHNFEGNEGFNDDGEEENNNEEDDYDEEDDDFDGENCDEDSQEDFIEDGSDYRNYNIYEHDH